MRAAFTGTSSTGKTTLANRVVLNPRGINWGGKFITTDARSLLRELGHGCVDEMTVEQRRAFQYRYLDRKIGGERFEINYVTDRSFVDVAAYWIEYNGIGPDDDDEFISKCQQNVRCYDVHFYFPVGLVPLEVDGFRSANVESRDRIDGLIRYLLAKWGVFYISLDMDDLDLRTAEVLDLVSGGRGE